MFLPLWDSKGPQLQRRPRARLLPGWKGLSSYQTPWWLPVERSATAFRICPSSKRTPVNNNIRKKPKVPEARSRKRADASRWRLALPRRNRVFAEHEETSMIREMVLSKKLARWPSASLWRRDSSPGDCSIRRVGEARTIGVAYPWSIASSSCSAIPNQPPGR